MAHASSPTSRRSALSSSSSGALISSKGSHELAISTNWKPSAARSFRSERQRAGPAARTEIPAPVTPGNWSMAPAIGHASGAKGRSIGRSTASRRASSASRRSPPSSPRPCAAAGISGQPRPSRGSASLTQRKEDRPPNVFPRAPCGKHLPLRRLGAASLHRLKNCLMLEERLIRIAKPMLRGLTNAVGCALSACAMRRMKGLCAWSKMTW